MHDVEFLEELEASVDAGRTTLILFTRTTTEGRERLIRGADRLLRRNPAVDSFHVDLDKHPTAAGRFTIYATPSYVVYHRRRMVGKVEGGFTPAHIARTLAALLG